MCKVTITWYQDFVSILDSTAIFIFSLASHLSCKAMLKISSKNIENVRGPMTYLDWPFLDLYYLDRSYLDWSFLFNLFHSNLRIRKSLSPSADFESPSP